MENNFYFNDIEILCMMHAIVELTKRYDKEKDADFMPGALSGFCKLSEYFRESDDERKQVAALAGLHVVAKWCKLQDAEEKAGEENGG